MSIARLIVFVSLALTSSSSFAALKAKPTDDALAQYSFTRLGKNRMDRIGRRFEIIARRGDVFEVLVPPAKAKEFLRLAPHAVLQVADIHEELRAAENTWGPGYHDMASVKSELETLAKDHPDLVRLHRYGKSEDGADLYALKLTDNVSMAEFEPQVLLTGATHGNEIITTEVILGLIQQLIAGYGTDVRLTKLVDELEIWFIPVVNPDGYSRRSRYANGIDPNRDYPIPGGGGSASNACIQNLITFFEKHNFKGSIDFHSYGGMVMYPWGYTKDALPSSVASEFKKVAGNMAGHNGYSAGQISRILYVAEGSSADYYFHQNKTLSFGIEIGNSHTPPPSSIPGAIKSQTESTWEFLEHFIAP